MKRPLSLFLFISSLCLGCHHKQPKEHFPIPRTPEEQLFDSLTAKGIAPKHYVELLIDTNKPIEVLKFADSIIQIPKAGPNSCARMQVFNEPAYFNFVSLAGNILSPKHYACSMFLSNAYFQFCLFDYYKGKGLVLPGIPLENAFWGATFKKRIYLADNEHRQDILFVFCHFEGNVFIGDLEDTLGHNIRFYRSKSDSSIKFDDPRKIITQRSAPVILGNIEFEGDSIAGKIDLSGVHFLKGHHLIYNNTTLPDTLDLSSASLSGKIDLRAASPNIHHQKCQINLLNTDVSKITLQYGSFHLYFPNHIEDSAQFNDIVSNTYQQLLDNFKHNGYDESYRSLNIEFNNWKAKSSFQSWISGWWWQYGYQKWRILIWSFVLLLLFSSLNVILYSRLMDTYRISQLDPDSIHFSRSKFVRLFERLWLSIVYTGIIFFRLSLDFEKVSIRSWAIFLLILFEYAAGLLCTGYLINWVLSK